MRLFFFIVRSLILVSYLLLPLNTHALEKSSLLFNTATRAYEHAINADLCHSPASLTKMMTLYLVFDALKKGTIQLNQRIRIPKQATRVEPSKMGLVAGEYISIEELILGMVIKSANDAAVTIAHHLGPTEEKFALEMNKKALDLGLKNTRFCNATGFYHPKQQTTARDMAMLGHALYKDHQDFYHYFARPHFQYKNRFYRNTNDFLHFPQDTQIDGIKTGYIKHAKHNFVVSAIRNGERLIAVVLGAHSRKERNDKIALLLQHRLPPPKVYIRYNHKKPAKHVKWSVQVGAFKARKNARDYLKKLQRHFQKENISLNYQQVKKENQTYKAHFGPYKKGEIAVETCQSLKKHGVECLVVTH